MKSQVFKTRKKLASAVISGRWQAPAAVMGARGPEGPSGDHRCCEAAAVVDERSEFEGPKGPRTSLKSEQQSGRLPVLLYIFVGSARNLDFYALIW